jgi:hypothetical protein
LVINGVPIAIQSGSWSQDMFLRNTAIQRRELHGATSVVIRPERRPADDPRVKVARIQEVNE